MPLFFELAAAAFFATLSPAPLRADAEVARAPVSPLEQGEAKELEARVEIGPAVLTIYGAKGEIVSVE